MRYFIDTNLIIDYCADETKKNISEDRRKRILEAKDKLNPILNDDESLIFTNRLVFLETLRTIPLADKKIFRELKQVFNLFEILDMNQAIYEQAVSFSRFCKSKHISLKGKCEAIDFLHFLTAKYYELELLTCDRDMAKLEEAYPDWKDKNEN
jgi:predicted nucleic acid-binding protein